MNHVPSFASITATRAETGLPVLYALDFKGRVWERVGNHPWRLLPTQTFEAVTE